MSLPGVTVDAVTTLHPVRTVPGVADHSSPDGVLPGAELLADLLAGTPLDEQPVTHVHHVPVRVSRTLPWPGWVPPELRSRLVERGVARPWEHQVEAAELARAGRSVVGAR